MDGATYFGFVLLFVVSVVVLGIYATRPRAVIQTASAHPTFAETQATGAEGTGVQPPAGESGFGIGIGATNLIDKPVMSPCSTLNRKPASADAASPELAGYFQPASSTVPTEYNPRTVGDCPPMKPMSSATPLANVPMCMAGQRLLVAA